MALFSTISSGVPDVFPQNNHPAPPPDNPGSQPVHTNKFYGNLLLDARTLPAFPHPYTVWNTGVQDFYGLGVSHVTADQRIFGPDASAKTAQYYFNPTMQMSVNLSAEQFASPPTFSTSAWGPLSVTAQFSAGNGTLKVPICNGMGFVTGVYSGLGRPIIGSQIGFKTVYNPVLVRRGLSKLRVALENNRVWLIYVSSPSGQNVGFTSRDPNHIFIDSSEAPLTVQVAVLYDDGLESVFDSAAGAYATDVTLVGGVTEDRSVATYGFQYNLAGASTGGGTLVYALPHHCDAFTSKMNGKVTNYYVDSTVLGKMRLCVTNLLEMYERLPRDVGFLPWSINKPTGDANFAFNNFAQSDIELLTKVAEQETANFDMAQATNVSSMYFSGKLIDKFALILLVSKYIIKDDGFTKQLLQRLQTAFDTFTSNKQQTPLFYDKDWKGLVSAAGVSDPGADFGNTYYNDHHFHYGYFIHAAAVVGQVDKEYGGTWAQTPKVKDWVNTLVRDVANYGNDPAFPISRSFDWFQGHSLAKGLFASGDGKDEESSSEDYHCHYGIKLWGNVIGDQNMESRANLVLAIERRALNYYMLYSNDNAVQPSQIIGNKVSGIKFENKIDHTTYFGTNLEYIQGIHMIPLSPISSFIRGPAFVQQEWEQVISGLVDKVDSGWKGILQLNRALYDPKSSYAFFSDNGFQAKWLDDGLTRTWALAFSKGLS